MTENHEEQALTTIMGGGEMIMTPDTAIALQSLHDRKVPPDKVRERPGGGGKMFKYVPHTYITRILLDAMPQTYSHDVLECKILGDGSAFARVRLMIHMPYKDQDGNVQIFTNTITEVGNFKGAKSMPEAAKLSSAASRGLAKAFMRRFGVGLEFYEEDAEEWTNDTAWGALWNHIKSQLSPKNDEINALAQTAAKMLLEHGIAKEDLVTKFDQAYKLIADWIKERRGEPVDIPEFRAPMDREAALNMDLPGKPGTTWYDYIEAESPETVRKTLTKISSPSFFATPTTDDLLVQQAAAILLEGLPKAKPKATPAEPEAEEAPPVVKAAPLDDF